MDWPTIIQENIQSIILVSGTLCGAIGGAVITGSITYFVNRNNNKYQLEKLNIEIEEKQVEARIQAKEKRTEDHIYKIMDGIETILTNYSTARYKFMEQKFGSVTWDEVRKQIFITSLDAEKHNDLIGIYLYSFDDEDVREKYRVFSKASRNLYEKWTEYMAIDDDEIEKKWVIELDTKIWFDFKKKAGELQKVLRNKLISLRYSNFDELNKN